MSLRDKRLRNLSDKHEALAEAEVLWEEAEQEDGEEEKSKKKSSRKN